MAEDSAVYSPITETQERMMIFDIYIIGSIGITIAILMIYSLINNKKHEQNQNDKYYQFAIKCCMILEICSVTFYLLKLLFNDLIIPINDFLINNIEFVSIIDSLEILVWSIGKISFYFGFAFIYLSLTKKDKIDTYLVVLMVMTFISTLIYCLSYLIDDLLSQSLSEISLTQKRGIYVISVANNNNSANNSISVVILGIVAILTEFIYVSLLLYRFISVSHIKKGAVLLSITTATFIGMVIIFDLDLNIKYIMVNIQILIDNICLFLMFNQNEEIYNNLCGCLCDKCFGSKYQAIQNQQDQEDGDVVV